MSVSPFVNLLLHIIRPIFEFVKSFFENFFDRKKNPVQRHLNLYKDRTKSHRRVDFKGIHAPMLFCCTSLSSHH